MIQQLILDGQEVDVSSGAITFTLKSNLFGEFGKIVAGSSQTVKLPRTVRNMQVMDIPEIPSRRGTKVRRKMQAMLLQDGVPIIRDGEAVLLKTSSEGYEIGITYGVVSFLSLVKDGGNLNELPDEGESVLWDSMSLVDYAIEKSGTYGFAEYDNGVNDVEKCQNTPVVGIQWLLGKIEERYGFNTVFGAGRYDLLADKYILLTGTKSSKEVLDNAVAEYMLSINAEIYEEGKDDDTADVWFGLRETVTAGYQVEVQGRRWVWNHPASEVVLNVTASLESTGGGIGGSRLVALKNGTEEIGSVAWDASLGYILDVTYTGGMKIGDYLEFVAYDVTKGTISMNASGMQMRCTYVWAEGQDPEGLAYPNYYSIIQNLPKMKLTEFIQLVGLLTGTFPLVENGVKDKLRMVAVEDLLERKEEAVDWSRLWDGEPTSVEYTLLEAKKNYIRWESDEDVEQSGVPVDGAIEVDDETLEVWNDLISIKLSGSNGGKIPQYRLTEDGEVEEEDVTERILRVVAGVAKYDEELYPATLRDTVLAGYRDIVREPILITGKFRLSELDIMTLDYVCPVYLSQMGRYYGIVEVKYKGEESEVKLIQLPL